MAKRKNPHYERKDNVRIIFQGHTYYYERKTAIRVFGEKIKNETGDVRKECIEIHYALRGGETICEAKDGYKYDEGPEIRRLTWICCGRPTRAEARRQKREKAMSA